MRRSACYARLSGARTTIAITASAIFTNSRFIRRARRLGFSIPEIGELLTLWRDRGRPSREVKRIAETHIGDLQSRVAEMQAMANTLRELVSACHGDDRPDCPILDDLALGGAAPG